MQLSTQRLAFLVGCEITQIVLTTKWCVSFVFVEDHHLVAEGRLEHFRALTGETLVYDLAQGLSGPLHLQDCLERKVEALEFSNKALTLNIDNGDVLRMGPDGRPHECLHITGPQGFDLLF